MRRLTALTVCAAICGVAPAFAGERVRQNVVTGPTPKGYVDMALPRAIDSSGRIRRMRHGSEVYVVHPLLASYEVVGPQGRYRTATAVEATARIERTSSETRVLSSRGGTLRLPRDTQFSTNGVTEIIVLGPGARRLPELKGKKPDYVVP